MELSHKVIRITGCLDVEPQVVETLCGTNIPHSKVHEQNAKVYHGDACAKCLEKLGVLPGLKGPLR
jgi:hypothetical protein